MATTGKKDGFTAAERGAMKARAEELRNSTARGADKRVAEEQDCLDKIADMADGDRAVAERIHAIVLDVAPQLTARTWYGMPAYALDGKVLCFFKPSGKFGMRYSTLGFQDIAALDDGNLWPSEYAVTQLTKADEQTVRALVATAIGG